MSMPEPHTVAPSPAVVQDVAVRWFAQDPAGWREDGVDGPDDLRKQVGQVLRCAFESGFVVPRSSEQWALMWPDGDWVPRDDEQEARESVARFVEGPVVVHRAFGPWKVAPDA
jgi:hypothetical protein